MTLSLDNAKKQRVENNVVFANASFNNTTDTKTYKVKKKY